MEIKQSFLDKSKYSLKCPYEMKPKGIVIHNTANSASAKNEVSYMKGNSSSTGFHIAVDNVEAIQVIPFTRNAFANGDGRNGEGNRNYISVEICYSKSGGDKFIKAEQNASKVVAKLLKQYGWTTKNVKAHRDFANKDCPHRTNMDSFRKLVQSELDALDSNKKEVYYRVVVASLKDKSQALAFQAKAKQAGFTDAFLVAFEK